MCGICGFTGYRQDQKIVIEKMMKAIVHRGPDSEGSFCRDEITLGFRRLSIIDPTDGLQPMDSNDGNLHIVFNGEIYNYKELRTEAEADGISFHTHSDTEVLVNTIQKYGEKAFDKLRGMYGFAVWNEKEQSLMLARDFFGIKPLYYAKIDGHFVFASEIKSILAFPGYERKVNQEALEQYLSFQYSPLEETFFRGIYKLMPGHMLLYKNGNYEIKTYFKAKLAPRLLGSKKDLEQLQFQLSRILTDSVRHHMLSDVEVGAFLSGGVDSGYLAVASGVKQAFSVGFDEGELYNEVDKAAEIAKKAGIKHHVRIISKQEFWDALPDVMYHMDEPLADASAVALYFLSKEAADHVKVVLSGEGADELFGGYNIYHEPISLKGYQKIPKCVRKGLAAVAKKMPDIKGRDFIIRGSKTVEERFIGNANMFSVEDREKLLKTKLTHKTPQDIVADAYKKVSHLNDIAKMQYIDTNFWLQGDILLKADKMSMAHCLESRVPFLDVKVFDYAKKLPIDFRCNDEATKRAFRIAAKRHIPEATANKKKLGFPVPIRVWLKEDNYYNKVMETLTGEAAQKFFNTDILVKLMEDHRAGKADNSRRIWTVYVFLVWYKVYFEDEDFRPINQDWIDNRVRTA